jgi:hypothetical protein
MPRPFWNTTLEPTPSHIIPVQNLIFYSLNHSKPEIRVNNKSCLKFTLILTLRDAYPVFITKAKGLILIQENNLYVV